MSKIVIDNVLKAIHYILEHNRYKYTEKQISLADEFITPYISELKIDEKEFNVKTVGAPKLSTDKRIVPILIKYFAYIEDNMSLYNELMKEKYLFYVNHVAKFYALDRVISGNFKINEYKNILLKYEGAVSCFYYSIRGLEKSERERYSKEFSDIVHRDQTTLKVGYKEGEEANNYKFLCKKNFDLFGKEFLLKLNDKQRNMINSLFASIDEKSAYKIKELINKYPDFNNANISIELINYLSVDEIYSLDIKDCVLYEVALRVGLQDRIRNILRLDPNFNCKSSFIKEEIFRVLSDEEIVGLSDLAKEEILNIKVPKIDNVLVMPVKKIKKIVAHDLKRREKNDSTGSIKK